MQAISYRLLITQFIIWVCHMKHYNLQKLAHWNLIKIKRIVWLNEYFTLIRKLRANLELFIHNQFIPQRETSILTPQPYFISSRTHFYYIFLHLFDLWESKTPKIPPNNKNPILSSPTKTWSKSSTIILSPKNINSSTSSEKEPLHRSTRQESFKLETSEPSKESTVKRIQTYGPC